MQMAINLSMCLLSDLMFSLFAKHSPAHLQNGFKSFSSPHRVFSKSLDAGFLDLRPYSLQTAAKRGYLGFLLELCLLLGICLAGLVDDGFSTGDQVRPRHIRRAHCDFLRLWVHVRDFVDVAGCVAAQQCGYPLWR